MKIEKTGGIFIERYSLDDSNAAIRMIFENYWSHLERISSPIGITNLKRRTSAITGLISSGHSLYKEVKEFNNKKKKTKRSLAITINNFTNYSLVLYKIERVKVAYAPNFILSADDSINISITDTAFKKDDGPRLHFCMDDGENSVFFTIQLGHTTGGAYNRPSQIRIRHLIVHNQIYDDHNGSSGMNFDELIGQTWRFNYTSFERCFFIQSPPISYSDGAININFI